MPTDSPALPFLRIFRGSAVRSLEPGEQLIRAGDSTERIYNVEAGLLIASRLGSDGGRQILGFIFPNNLIGLTDQARYQFSVQAVLPSSISGAPRTALAALLDEDLTARREFMSMMCRVLDRYQDLVFSLGQRTATERLAVLLLFLRHQGLESNCPWASQEALSLPIGRNDIADFLGLKTETVSRSLKALEKAGLVKRLTATDIRFEDLAGLRRLAGTVDLTTPGSITSVVTPASDAQPS